MIINERDHHFGRRSNSAWAKYADALRRISLTLRSSGSPARAPSDVRRFPSERRHAPPLAISAFLTHSLSDCDVQPIFAAIEVARRPPRGMILLVLEARAERRVRALRVKTGSSSCLPSLHLLKVRSLRQTRRGSTFSTTARLRIAYLPYAKCRRGSFAAARTLTVASKVH